MNNDTVSIAKSWIGTRWVHGQSLKGVGADCIQFIISVAKESGQIPEEYKSIRYSQDWALHNSRSILLEEIQKLCIQISIEDIQVGDILIFNYGKCASHAGIYIGDRKMIHSKIRSGVIESGISRYMPRFNSAWRVYSGR